MYRLGKTAQNKANGVPSATAPDESVVNVTFKPLKPPEVFFDVGRPLVDPKRPRLYLSRRFDFILLSGIVVSFIALVVHLILIIVQLPKAPTATNSVHSQCSVMDGEWNAQHDVLRFWGIPYAVPPVIESDTSFPEVMYDIAEKHNLQPGGFRWYQTFSVPDTEYCFLSFDDRCAFTNGSWKCYMGRHKRNVACVELDKNGEIVANATEHCLTLDIAMPAFHGTLLPVIVVLTGFRSFRNPISEDTIKEPAYLPTDEAVTHFGAIWINARYRLGPLGSFYDFNTLGRDDTNHTNYMNFGLRDQRALLIWVQHNVGRFGGDASKVVLLAHGSGATGALELLHLQSKLNSSEQWFHSAWIASGALNWHDASRDSWQEFIPKKFLKELQSCQWGSKTKQVLNNFPCVSTFRERYMKMELQTLLGYMQPYYRDNEWATGILSTSKLQDIKPLMWFAVDNEFDAGTPADWSTDVVNKIFYHYTSEDKPKLKMLVFSSMSSEFEGFPGTADESPGNLASFKELLNQVTYEQYKNLFEHLIQLEEIRTKQKNAWPPHLKDWEVMLNALSAIRYTCPQAYLMSRWLFNHTLRPGERATQFYHIYHNEAPRHSFSKIPGLPKSGNRRLPFHGMDMLILTGHHREQPKVFESYRRHLWSAFKNFVDGQPLSEFCEIKLKPVFDDTQHEVQVGCMLNSHGAIKHTLNGTIDSICKQIDWDSYFQDLAMFE